MRDAIVFDLGLKGEDACVLSLDDRIFAMFAEASEAVDSVRPPIGTVKESAVDVEGRLYSPGGGASTSGGIWSAGGIGRPFAAATSWYSVHSESKSSRPRQKGAMQRII